MSFMETMEKERSLMALSLLVAALLWLFTFSEGEGEIGLTVPLAYRNLSPDYIIVNHPPTRVELYLTGSRLQLLRQKIAGLNLPLDLDQAGEGMTSFGELEKSVRLGPGLHVSRVMPAVIHVKTARAPRRQ